ncbi:MAG: T9SS type A sorting domain-containing protein [Bacteroidia bacterium]|nr:T9SS type A sorting domain-containing protein [Bacteroidia bacterium]
MRKLLQFLMVFCSAVCWGQQQDMLFTKVWGVDNNFGFSEVDYVDQLECGDYVVIGLQAQNLLGGARKFYFCRLDSTGRVLSESVWGNEDNRHSVVKVIKIATGDYVVCGNYYSSQSDFMLTKIDQLGNILFFSVFDFQFDDYASNLILTTDSCFVLTGCANNSYPALLKVDAQGSEIWRRTQNAEVGYIPLVSCQTSDSGFVLCGSYGSIDNSYCAGYDKNGYMLWVKYHFGLNINDSDCPKGIRGNSNGTFDILYDIDITSSLPPVSERTALIHCDQYGDTISSTMFIDRTTAVFLVDSSWFHVITSGRNYARIDTSGVQEFVLIGIDHEVKYCIPTQDSGFIAGGYAGTWTLNYQNTKFQVTKFGTNGSSYAWPFAENVSVYPNPAFASQMNVSFDVQSDEQVEILLWSTTGVLVKTNSIFCPANSNTIMPVLSEGDVLASGSYILEIRAGDQSYRQIVIIGNTTLKEN